MDDMGSTSNFVLQKQVAGVKEVRSASAAVFGLGENELLLGKLAAGSTKAEVRPGKSLPPSFPGRRFS